MKLLLPVTVLSPPGFNLRIPKGTIYFTILCCRVYRTHLVLYQHRLMLLPTLRKEEKPLKQAASPTMVALQTQKNVPSCSISLFRRLCH